MEKCLTKLQIEGINEVNNSLSKAISNLSQKDNLSDTQIQMINALLHIIEKGYDIQSSAVGGEM